jgi:Ca-activated chloride channel family protein
MTAARLAKDLGIRIYTIGAGSVEGGLVPMPTLFGTILQRGTEGVDEESLKKIAATTGAKYYRATDTETLEEAYQEINKLETTEVDLNDYYEHTEGFVPYALAGTVALLLSVFARRQWFEVIP